MSESRGIYRQEYGHASPPLPPAPAEAPIEDTPVILEESDEEPDTP